MVNIIGAKNSIFNQFMSQLRNAEVQKDSMRFRRNLERIGEIMAYEISKQLTYETKDVITPMGVASMNLLSEKPVLATVLRAGLPLHQGLLNYFDDADNAFISAYRKHHKDNTFEVKVDYLATPTLTGRTLILSDPMLATGTSMVLSYQALITRGMPAHIHIVSVVASMEGLAYVKRYLPKNVTFWLGAVDEELTVQSFIVPGLGDAGDLAFGTK